MCFQQRVLRKLSRPHVLVIRYTLGFLYNSTTSSP